MSDTLNWLDMHKHATTKLEGEFPLVIVEAVVAKTNDQTKDMIKCKLKIESGPYVDRPINVNFTISPDSPIAMRILFTHWAIFGVDDKFFVAHPSASLQQIADTLVGRRAIGVVGTRQWNGRDIEDIKEWKPALGGPGNGTGTLGMGSGLSTPLGAASASPLASSTRTQISTSPGVSSVPEVSSAASSTPHVSSPAQPSSPAPERPF